MDITPQVINEVEFHQKMRGYDPDEVDDFLERVAVAVGELQDRIREAMERAQLAERRVGDLESRVRDLAARPAEPVPPPVAVPSTDDDAEQVKRMILIAQRTADEAVAEAKEDARRMVADAEERSRAIVAEAEVAARASADDTRRRLVAEIISLEESRDSLRADHGILERHLDEQRLRLRSAIADLQRVLDDPGRLRRASDPQLADKPLPEFLQDETPAAPPEPVDASEPPVEPEAAAPEVIDLDIDLDAPPVSIDPRPSGGVVFTPAGDEPLATFGAEPALVSEDDTDAWARFTAAGPDTQALTFDADDDAYLGGLRRAVAAGGEGAIAGYHDEGRMAPRPRFGRRR